MQSCENMAEKLSAWMDGELEPSEEALVKAHLGGCPSCRRLLEGMKSADRLIIRLHTRPEPALKGRIQEALRMERARPGRRRWLGAAVAALALIAASLFILATGDRADARKAAARMVAIEEINRLALQDQEALLKTLEWDLNAMKMMVSCSDLEAEKAQGLLQRIEELQDEVERVGRKEDKSKGDEK